MYINIVKRDREKTTPKNKSQKLLKSSWQSQSSLIYLECKKDRGNQYDKKRIFRKSYWNE